MILETGCPNSNQTGSSEIDAYGNTEIGDSRCDCDSTQFAVWGLVIMTVQRLMDWWTGGGRPEPENNQHMEMHHVRKLW